MLPIYVDVHYTCLGAGGGKTHATLEPGAAQGAASGAAQLAPAPQAHSTSSTTCSEQSCQSRPCTVLSPARPRRGWRDAGGRPERRGAPALCRWGKTLRSGEPVEARCTGRAVNGHKRQPGSLHRSFIHLFVRVRDHIGRRGAVRKKDA